MANRSTKPVPHPVRPDAGRSHQFPNGVELHLQLRALRRRLADAWWYEEPLETIESIERAIEQCLHGLRRHGRPVAPNA
ncbi:MAG: hypothetical protein JXB13_14455 [Phycisphaerae bacterium]|nr:hypothetical protein [Phycisphaerae bacterium]